LNLLIDARSGSEYVSNSSPFAIFTKERTLVAAYIIPRLLSSVIRLMVVSSINELVLFHSVAKSTLDKVIVMKTIKMVILSRYTKFIGVVRSPKLFLKSLTTRLNAIDVVLEAMDDTEA